MAWPVCVPTAITLARETLYGPATEGVVHELRVIDLSIVSGVATPP